VKGDAATRKNLVTSIHLAPADLEAHVVALEEKYRRIRAAETLWDTYRMDDAEVILVGYGIVARILRNSVDLARREGIAVGLFRPLTLWPFPTDALRSLSAYAERFLVVEMSNGQMVEDVRLAVSGRCPVDFYGRAGGVVPTDEEVVGQLLVLREGGHVRSVV
jgi:pyruvate/2-oxoacid:ferredoxin oxidoreductase alpha subunit